MATMTPPAGNLNEAWLVRDAPVSPLCQAPVTIMERAVMPDN